MFNPSGTPTFRTYRATCAACGREWRYSIQLGGPVESPRSRRREGRFADVTTEACPVDCWEAQLGTSNLFDASVPRDERRQP